MVCCVAFAMLVGQIIAFHARLRRLFGFGKQAQMDGEAGARGWVPAPAALGVLAFTSGVAIVVFYSDWPSLMALLKGDAVGAAAMCRGWVLS